jgi:hypothetical protein
MRPEYEVIGGESTGRVDFAIKVLGQFFLDQRRDILIPYFFVLESREPYLRYRRQTTAKCNRGIRSEYRPA